MTDIIFQHENLNVKIKDWHEIFPREKEPFVKYSEWFADASIKVDAIVGTEDPAYVGISYNELLNIGTRMELNQRLYNMNPLYYNENFTKFPHIFYQCLSTNSDIYVQVNGNHRTAIAKLHKELTGHNILHGVNLYRYTIDEEFYSLYEQLKEKYKHISATRKLISCEDEAGYKKDIYEIFLSINGISYDMEESYKLLKKPSTFSGKLKSLIKKALRENK